MEKPDAKSCCVFPNKTGGFTGLEVLWAAQRDDNNVHAVDESRKHEDIHEETA